MTTQVFTKADEAEIQAAAALLRAGELVAFPTETVYGLGADACKEEAVGKIYRAKGRESDNPLIVHFADWEEIPAYTEIPDRELFETLCRAFMPGPLTLVLPRGGKITPRVSAGLSTVAVRCPDHKIAHDFLAACVVPVAAPSANRSHRPSPTKAAHVLEDLSGEVAAVLDGGDCGFGVESTVVLPGKELCILRPGAVTREMLEEASGRRVCVSRGVTEPVEASEPVQSPGMKYKHYAPNAPMTAIYGEDGAVRACFSEMLALGHGILCWEEDCAFLPRDQRVISLGHRKDALEQARRLYDALRTFDALGVPAIEARLPEQTGMGLAVYNRLMRACAFRSQEVKR